MVGPRFLGCKKTQGSDSVRFLAMRFLVDEASLQGYLGYKNTLAPRSVGLYFLELRKTRQNSVGPISLCLKTTHEGGRSAFSSRFRKRRKVFVPRFHKFNKTQGESGRCS